MYRQILKDYILIIYLLMGISNKNHLAIRVIRMVGNIPHQQSTSSTNSLHPLYWEWVDAIWHTLLICSIITIACGTWLKGSCKYENHAWGTIMSMLIMEIWWLGYFCIWCASDWSGKVEGCLFFEEESSCWVSNSLVSILSLYHGGLSCHCWWSKLSQNFWCRASL